MRILNKIPFLLFFISTIQLFSSCIGNASFTPNEMRFTKSFQNSSVAIYRSEQGQVDTIEFSKLKIDTVRYRNFEQGFSNENSIYIGYELTGNSFHKITVHSINKEPENFLLFIKAKNSHSSKQISFLGLIFNEDYLDKIINTEENYIVFNSENAQYKGININEGIKSFKFDFGKGIISFIDKRGVEWTRIN